MKPYRTVKETDSERVSKEQAARVAANKAALEKQRAKERAIDKAARQEREARIKKNQQFKDGYGNRDKKLS
jgi:hypothetical protein